MREDITAEIDSEKEQNSEQDSSEEEDSDEWTEDEEGISDDRWERMRTWECDIGPVEDEEHRHFNEEHCQESREFLTRKAKLVAENVELRKIAQEQEVCLARMAERTEYIKRKNAERRSELATLRADRAKRARNNAPRPG